MKLLLILLVIITQSCAFFNINLNKEEDTIVKEVADSMVLKMLYKENYDRIFANSFYDMTGNYNRDEKNSKMIVTANLNFIKFPSGMDIYGIAMQYMKIGTLTYTLKVKQKNKNYGFKSTIPVDETKLKNVKKITTPKSKSLQNNKMASQENSLSEDEYIYYELDSGVLQSQMQYGGSPVDLFAEYVASLDAEENVARQIARELYYSAIITIRLHLIRCRKIGEILEKKRHFVFANDKSDLKTSDKTLNDIDLKNIKKVDYEVHQNVCNIM